MQFEQSARDHWTKAFLIATCVILMTLFFCAVDVRAAVVSVVLRIDQSWDSDGNVDYTFTPFRSAGTDEFTTIVREPNGNVIPANVPIEHLSFADIQSRFFGTWSVQDGTPTPNYTFSYGSFGLDAVFHERPIITAPIPGATLKPGFDFRWHYASGAMPPNDLNLYMDAISKGSVGIFWRGGQDWEVDDNLIDRVTHLPLPQDVVTLLVGRQTSLTTFVSPLTLIGPKGPNTLVANSFFVNLSAPVTVTVVPEPGTVALFASACAMLLGKRFSRRRSR